MQPLITHLLALMELTVALEELTVAVASQMERGALVAEADLLEMVQMDFRMPTAERVLQTVELVARITHLPTQLILLGALVVVADYCRWMATKLMVVAAADIPAADVEETRITREEVVAVEISIQADTFQIRLTPVMGM
jgi:hypothetical protein